LKETNGIEIEAEGNGKGVIGKEVKMLTEDICRWNRRC